MARAKKTEAVDLGKIATQLAKVKVIAVAEDDSIALTGTAIFDFKTFEFGNYRVSIGITQALLHLDHPSFEVESKYEAALEKDAWSQVTKSSGSKSLSGSAKFRIGALIPGFLRGSGEAQASKEHKESSERKSNLPYRLVSSTPTGWRIGSELGDPRSAEALLPDGLEGCLAGEYLSGRNGEKGDGHKAKIGKIALCVLRPIEGSSDPRIVATLCGASGSLLVNVEKFSDASTGLHASQEEKDQQEKLRRAFVEICIQRATQAGKEGAQIEDLLTGEFYLHHQEINAPKLVSSSKAKTANMQITETSLHERKATAKTTK